MSSNWSVALDHSSSEPTPTHRRDDRFRHCTSPTSPSLNHRVTATRCASNGLRSKRFWPPADERITAKCSGSSRKSRTPHPPRKTLDGRESEPPPRHGRRPPVDRWLV